MGRVRVIGRIDLAAQIHAALSAAGVDARVATAAPLSVAAATGRDGSEVDVIGQDLGTCAAIKKVMPARPVVLVTALEALGSVTFAERCSRGPDAHVVWPAIGQEIAAACDRAKAAAGAPRPRIQWQVLVGGLGALAAVGGAILWAAVHGETASRVVLVGGQLILGMLMLGASALEWKRAPATRHSRWLRAYSICLFVWAGDLLVSAMLSLLKRGGV